MMIKNILISRSRIGIGVCTRKIALAVYASFSLNTIYFGSIIKNIPKRLKLLNDAVVVQCYLKNIFLFSSGVKAKCGVEFRHSPRNVSRMWGMECLNTMFLLYLITRFLTHSTHTRGVGRIRREADLI